MSVASSRSPASSNSLPVVPNRLTAKLKEHGVYILTIVVTGDGVSKSEQIEVETDGTFEGFKARPVTPAAKSHRVEGSSLQPPSTAETALL
jgi:hypothetical protein